MGIHVSAVLLLVLIVEYHPATPLPPSNVSLADAVAVNIVPPPQPQSPPQPPQPQEPQSTPPVPQPPPQTISTEASQADISTPPPLSVPPPPAPPQPEQSQTTPLEATYAQIVSALLEANKRYPRQALLAGNQGTVVLSFVLNREGTVLAYRIEESSGQPIFDEAVKRLIQHIHFPPFPKGDLSQRKTFTVPILFELTG